MRSASREEDLGGAARVEGIWTMMQEALEHLQRIVVPSRSEVTDRVVDVPRARIRLGEAKVREWIGVVEIDDLPEDLDRARFLPHALELRRDFVVGIERVGHEAELRVELGELRRDVRIALGDLGDVLLDDLADLFVNSDGLEREALRRVILSDPLVGGDRVGVRLHLRLQVTDLQQRPGVVRILLDDLLVFRDRPVVSFFLNVALGGQQHLLAVNRHFL